MDTAYITWVFLIGGGALLAVFVKSKRIMAFGAALFACALAGLVVSGVLGGGNLTVVFGMAAAAIPVVFAMLATGAWVGAVVIGKVRRNRAGS
jgi:peptidoglycan/LPS O-acetylase OafA/YrhL